MWRRSMLDRVLFWLSLGSLGVALVRRYLTLNRLWVHRREGVVAGSVSVVALLLATGAGAPLLADSLRQGDRSRTASEVAAMVGNGFMALVGAGLWVPGKRAGVGRRLLGALRAEGAEAGELISRMIWPPGAPQVIRILRQVAALDGHVDARERTYIARLAGAWGVKFNPRRALPMADQGHGPLRQSVIDYLDLAPTREQATELLQMIRTMVGIDQSVSPDEEVALAELSAMLGHYAGSSPPASFRLAIVPATPAQRQAVAELVPGARPTLLDGVDVFLAETYFARPYAELMCKRYRALDLHIRVVSDAELALATDEKGKRPC